MHSELPGLAMNSHFGSVGSSSAALGATLIAHAESTSASTTHARTARVLIAIPFASLRGRRRPQSHSGANSNTPSPPARAPERNRPNTADAPIPRASGGCRMVAGIPSVEARDAQRPHATRSHLNDQVQQPFPHATQRTGRADRYVAGPGHRGDR